jgi:uncharacterized protein with FMN-binding domain
VESKSEMKTKRKEKGKMSVWLIVLIIIVAVLGIGGAIGWSYLSREHNEARNISLDGADFNNLKDGVYIGEYEGGMYKWRANEVQVTVSSGKVTDIEQINSSDPGKENTNQSLLYDRVIKDQSLQVDTISGATLTSKAYLKAVENALIKAQKLNKHRL